MTLLGHSKLEHRSDGIRFQCWMLHIALLTLTHAIFLSSLSLSLPLPAALQLYPGSNNSTFLTLSTEDHKVDLYFLLLVMLDATYRITNPNPNPNPNLAVKFPTVRSL